MAKFKILPLNEGKYICVICFNSTSKKRVFKCENNKCSEGIICYKCIEQYNEYGYGNKCPLCRNNSNAFIVEKINFFSNFKKLQVNIRRNSSCNFLLIFKIIIYSSLYFIINTITGLIVCTILRVRPDNSPVFIWFITGFLFIFMTYITAGFCLVITGNR